MIISINVYVADIPNSKVQNGKFMASLHFLGPYLLVPGFLGLAGAELVGVGVVLDGPRPAVGVARDDGLPDAVVVVDGVRLPVAVVVPGLGSRDWLAPDASEAAARAAVGVVNVRVCVTKV